MLKCCSIVCLSSFVCLTNEVYSDTGWETSKGGGESHNGSRCTGTVNMCTAASVVGKHLPLKKRGNCLLINGSVTDTYIQRWLYQHIAIPFLIPLLLPTNPFSAGQLPRCILPICDIVEVKLQPIVWMWCVFVCMLSPHLQGARDMGGHTSVSVTL